VFACVGGGSNAIGLFHGFIADREVEIVGVEAGGRGPALGDHSATLARGKPGVLHGSYSMLLFDTDGQIQETHSVSAGLDYPGVGPEHALLQRIGRVRYEAASDEESLAALAECCRHEGILPAIETAPRVRRREALGTAESRQAAADRRFRSRRQGRGYAGQRDAGTRRSRRGRPYGGCMMSSGITSADTLAGETGGAAGTITDAIRAASAEERPALVPFFTAGYPDRDAFADTLARVAGAADVVEIGVPFTDPMADGMSIQRASHAGARAGVTPAAGSWIEIAALPSRPAAPLLLMSYLNPLLAFGFERLAARAVEAGVAGFIVPDLPFEESAELRQALDARGVALVQLVSPLTGDQRLPEVTAASRGFVYAVTTTGVTGGQGGVGEQVGAYLDRVRAASPLPVCAGFGIRGADDVQRLAGHVDGVIVGSALVEALERGEDPAPMLRALVGR
jgi:tryptophan synthase alpha chain